MSYIDWEKEPDTPELLTAWKLIDSRLHEAFHRLEALAERGSATSMALIGDIYHYGRSGHFIDRREAEKWLRKGAALGSAMSCYFLSRLLVEARRYDEVPELLRTAIAQGYAPAMNLLGRLYWAGAGVEKDIERARHYLERAAAKGSLMAKAGLAALGRRHPRSRSDKIKGYLFLVLGIGELLTIIFTEGPSSEKLQ
jgi:TPR repeat protein